MLSTLYQDEHFVIIDKPSGMLVHRTTLTSERLTAMTTLRDQLGRWVYPVHRLDRATSGILVFALSPDAARAMGTLFQDRNVQKIYYAVVRGHMADAGMIDHPLQEDEFKERVPAVSRFATLGKVEWPVALGRYSTARYSLVRVEPETGRRHQIRKHLCSVFHPIIGDTSYGDGKHNRFFRDQFGISRLMLHAGGIEFVHPIGGNMVKVKSQLPKEFETLEMDGKKFPALCS